MNAKSRSSFLWSFLVSFALSFCIGSHLVGAEIFQDVTESGIAEGFVRTSTLELLYDNSLSASDAYWVRQAAYWVNEQLDMRAVWAYPYKDNILKFNVEDSLSTIHLDTDDLKEGKGGKAFITVNEEWWMLNIGFNREKEQYIELEDFKIHFVKSVDYHRRGEIMSCDIKINRFLRHFSQQLFNVVLRHEILHCLGFTHFNSGVMKRSSDFSDDFLPEKTAENWFAEVLKLRPDGFMEEPVKFFTIWPAREQMILTMME